MEGQLIINKYIERVSNDQCSPVNMSRRERPVIGILGAGNFGYALAKNLRLCGADLCFGTGTKRTLLMNDVEVLRYEEAVKKCDILFLCIPVHAYGSIADRIKQHLSGKIIVDVSNTEKKGDPCNALRLQALLPNSNVVKALNNLSAYYLENLEYGGDKETYICGDNEESKHKVMGIIREIGITPVDRGLLRSAIALEELPHRFFPGWGTAVTITLALLVPLWLYYYLRIFWYNQELSKRELNDLSLYIGNRVIAWLMFWLLALTYLPGVLAGYIQLVRRTKYIRFPNWLDTWMRVRKQLGLICLFLAGIHACASCLVLGSGEAVHMLVPHKIPNTTLIVYQSLDNKNQISLLFATFSMALMTVLGVTSLPSVRKQLSWKEWNFVQSTLGFTTLVFGFIHVMAYVWELWADDTVWKFWERNPRGVFPAAAFVMPMFPLLVIGLRLVLMLPGISCCLSNIRAGRIGYRSSSNVKNV